MCFTKHTQKKFHSSTNPNLAAAARQTRDADQNRRREELQRRIEETRQKLQNVRNTSLPPFYPSNLHLPAVLSPLTIPSSVMSHGLTMTSTFDSCTDDSHCYNDNHDGTERRELIGRSCSGHEELGMCLDGWNAVSSQTTHSTTVPDTILVAGPFSVKTMFTPLLVQQWQGVTWMTQCERLPDRCDAAA